MNTKYRQKDILKTRQRIIKKAYEVAKENYKTVCETLWEELVIENWDILKRVEEH